MQVKRAFEQNIEGCVNMALATSVDGQPNVRVVTFVYDPASPYSIYFTTFPGNIKIQEFENNNKVCVLPISPDWQAESQVRINGTVKKSKKATSEVIALLAKKDEQAAKDLIEMGDILLVYQIDFTEAQVTIGMSAPQIFKI